MKTKMLSALAVLIILSGCVQRELEKRPTEGEVEISMVWADGPNSRSTRLLFYDQDGSLTKDVSGVGETHKGMLPLGTYNIIAINEGVNNVEYHGLENYSTAEVRAVVTDGIFLSQPQDVYGVGAFNESSTITMNYLTPEKRTITPKSVTHTIKLYFTVDSRQEILSLTGELSGISAGVLLSTGEKKSDRSYSVRFEGRSITKSSIQFEATVNFFDVLVSNLTPEHESDVSITIVDGTGKTYDGVFPLTETIQHLLDGHDGLIPDDIPIDVKVEVSEVYGLTATVTLWDDSGTGSGGIETD